MYEAFYGLTERPFDLTPNWRYLYLTAMHKEALSAIQYGVTARRGIVAVIGEAGTGKTTIVRAALRAIRSAGVRQVYLSNPRLTRTEFLRFLGWAFRLGQSPTADKADLIAALTARLMHFHAKGRSVVLVVDEAQSMPDDLLEEIRLLANIETSTAKLLQVVMVGQPELAARLNEPGLRQLKQRIAIRATLKTLDLRSTAAFIAGRIRVAGGKPAEVFTSRAVETVFAHSSGIPRTINVICDNALLSGFAADRRPVGHDIIEEVCRDFDLPRCVDLPVVGSTSSFATTNPPAKPAESVSEVDALATVATVAPVPPAETPKLESPGTPGPVTHEENVVGQNRELFAMSAKRRRPSIFDWIRG